MRGSHGAIIVGVDGSEDSTTALAWALRTAQIAGLAVCVTHVWLPEGAPDDPQPDEHGRHAVPIGARFVRDRAMTEVAARDRVHRSMSAATARVPVGRSHVTQLAIRGEPGDVLVDLSRDGVEIVLGALGSGALPGMLTPALGSVTRHVLRHARCPVTVVPSTRLREGDPTWADRPAAVPSARSPHAAS